MHERWRAARLSLQLSAPRVAWCLFRRRIRCAQSSDDATSIRIARARTRMTPAGRRQTTRRPSLARGRRDLFAHPSEGWLGCAPAERGRNTAAGCEDGSRLLLQSDGTDCVAPRSNASRGKTCDKGPRCFGTMNRTDRVLLILDSCALPRHAYLL